MSGATCHTAPPAKFVKSGATSPSDYAYPECFAYPIHDAAHVRAAAARFAQHGKNIPAPQRAKVARRIKLAEKRFGIATSKDSSSKAPHGDPMAAKKKTTAKSKRSGKRGKAPTEAAAAAAPAAAPKKAKKKAAKKTAAKKASPAKKKAAKKPAAAKKAAPKKASKPAKKRSAKKAAAKAKPAKKRAAKKPTAAKKAAKKSAKKRAAKKAAAKAKPAKKRAAKKAKPAKKSAKKRAAKKAAAKAKPAKKRAAKKASAKRATPKKKPAKKSAKKRAAKKASAKKPATRVTKSYSVKGAKTPAAVKKATKGAKKVSKSETYRKGGSLIRVEHRMANPVLNNDGGMAWKSAAVFTGGLVVGVALAMIGDRLVATRAKDAKYPWYSHDAALRIMARPDAARLLTQGGIALALFAGSVASYKKMPILSAFFAGAAFGALGHLAGQAIGIGLAKILKVEKGNERSVGNRILPMEQDAVQEQNTKLLEAQDKNWQTSAGQQGTEEALPDSYLYKTPALPAPSGASTTGAPRRGVKRVAGVGDPTGPSGQPTVTYPQAQRPAPRQVHAQPSSDAFIGEPVATARPGTVGCGGRDCRSQDCTDCAEDELGRGNRIRMPIRQDGGGSAVVMRPGVQLDTPPADMPPSRGDAATPQMPEDRGAGIVPTDRSPAGARYAGRTLRARTPIVGLGRPSLLSATPDVMPNQRRPIQGGLN